MLVCYIPFVNCRDTSSKKHLIKPVIIVLNQREDSEYIYKNCGGSSIVTADGRLPSN